ncbi:TPA: DUF2971 domain-containing protein [Legionella anisa]
MLLIPLYKYLDTKGALATLRNQTFKWTKPSEFIAKYKDTTDMTVSNVFPQSSKEVTRVYKNEFVSTLLERFSPLPNKGLQFVSTILHEHTNIAQMVQYELAIESETNLFNLKQINSISEEILKEINKALQKCRVLCMSSDNLSKRMWQDYSEDEKGIILGIRPSPDKNKDSIFNLFKPVKYFKMRPFLFDSPQDFLRDSIFEDRHTMIARIIEKITYAKTLPYSYESEYRCIDVCSDCNFLQDLFIPFHPEEITALYIGRKCAPNYRSEFIHLAKKINPNIGIFQITQQSSGALYASPFSTIPTSYSKMQI